MDSNKENKLLKYHTVIHEITLYRVTSKTDSYYLKVFNSSLLFITYIMCSKVLLRIIFIIHPLYRKDESELLINTRGWQHSLSLLLNATNIIQTYFVPAFSNSELYAHIAEGEVYRTYSIFWNDII